MWWNSDKWVASALSFLNELYIQNKAFKSDYLKDLEFYI